MLLVKERVLLEHRLKIVFLILLLSRGSIIVLSFINWSEYLVIMIVRNKDCNISV